MQTLEQVRADIERCRNDANRACQFLICYRDGASIEGASHPLLFQLVANAKVMIIGAVPGSLDANPSKSQYQQLVRGQFSLGHKSAQGLGEILLLVARLKGITASPLLKELPVTEAIQSAHLEWRSRLGLHVTNLVKCHAPSKWESSFSNDWAEAAHSCQSLHLVREVKILDPSMVVLLGTEVTRYFSRREKWDMDNIPISTWSSHAGMKPFYGRTRYVTGWCHPGGNFFWIQGRRYWQDYAEQMVSYVRAS